MKKVTLTLIVGAIVCGFFIFIVLAGGEENDCKYKCDSGTGTAPCPNGTGGVVCTNQNCVGQWLHSNGSQGNLVYCTTGTEKCIAASGASPCGTSCVLIKCVMTPSGCGSSITPVPCPNSCK